MSNQNMKAIVIHAAGDLRIDEVDIPAPSDGEVLIKVEWGGICGSDVAYVSTGASGTAVLKEPLVLGHEIAGRVAALGDGVTSVAVGDPVTVFPATLVGDGRMPDRLAGRHNLYPRVRYFGSAAHDPHTDGGMSEYKLAREDQVVPLPPGLDTKRGALAEPLAVGVHAIHRAATVLAGGVNERTILVNGAGPIGLLLMAAAMKLGAAEVIAADLSQPALERASAIGVHETVLIGEQELPEDIELIFEASGSPRALGSVLGKVARGGVVVQVGNLPATPVEAVLGQLVTREVIWIGSYRFADEMSEAVRLLADGLHVDPIMSHEFHLDDAKEAFRVASDRSTGASKVMISLGVDPDLTK